MEFSSSAHDTTAEFPSEFNGFKYGSLPDLELAISLEFLSSMKSEEIQSIHKISDVVMPAILHYLSKGKRLVVNKQKDSSSNNNNISNLVTLFEKVQRDLIDVKDNFKRLREWEDRLDSVIKSLMADDWEVFSSERTPAVVQDMNQPNRMQMALDEIGKKVSELKLHISLPFETSAISSSDAQAQPSQLPSSSEPNEEIISEVTTTIPNEESADLSFSKKFSEGGILIGFQALYDSLNPQLQHCLLYFSVLPKGCEIRKTVLTYLWIGERFIDSSSVTGNLSANDDEIAAQFFKELVDKGFIKPVHELDVGEFNSCQMNPSFHSAVFSLAKKADFFDFDSNGNPTANSIRSGRACLRQNENRWQQLSELADIPQDKLRTLFNFNEEILVFPSNFFSNMKNVTVIRLGRWQSSTLIYIEVEDSNILLGLSKLKKLRYLSLRGVSRVAELPDSMWRGLSNLRILDLNACDDLELLPNEIGLLKKLTHLDISECYLLDYMPKALASLSELQVLKGFVIGGGSIRKDQCKLSDLGKLEKLTKLTIYIGGEDIETEEDLSYLSQFRVLRVLILTWWGTPLQSKSDKGEMKHDKAEVIVKFPSLLRSLEKVDLRASPWSTMPHWLNPGKLEVLKKLYIRGGSLCNLEMNDHSTQRTVKFLRLKYLNEMQIDWPVLNRLFPNLVYVEKVECPKLVSFPFEGEWRLAESSTAAAGKVK